MGNFESARDERDHFDLLIQVILTFFLTLKSQPYHQSKWKEVDPYEKSNYFMASIHVCLFKCDYASL